MRLNACGKRRSQSPYVHSVRGVSQEITERYPGLRHGLCEHVFSFVSLVHFVVKKRINHKVHKGHKEKSAIIDILRYITLSSLRPLHKEE